MLLYFIGHLRIFLTRVHLELKFQIMLLYKIYSIPDNIEFVWIWWFRFSGFIFMYFYSWLSGSIRNFNWWVWTFFQISNCTMPLITRFMISFYKCSLLYEAVLIFAKYSKTSQMTASKVTNLTKWRLAFRELDLANDANGHVRPRKWQFL